MDALEPQTTPITCPRCGESAIFALPYHMTFLNSEELAELKRGLLSHSKRLQVEEREDRQIIWLFPDLYSGPWQGWDCANGVCICDHCHLRRRHSVKNT